MACAWAGLFAGTTSTVAQLALWIAFTDGWIELLWRDSRLAAAILMGKEVLQGAGADAAVFLCASAVHFAISFVYAHVFLLLATRCGLSEKLWFGVALGTVMYGINLYAFTAVFPWFELARGPITLLAHGVFGASVMAAARYERGAGSQSAAA